MTLPLQYCRSCNWVVFYPCAGGCDLRQASVMSAPGSEPQPHDQSSAGHRSRDDQTKRKAR